MKRHLYTLLFAYHLKSSLSVTIYLTLFTPFILSHPTYHSRILLSLKKG